MPPTDTDYEILAADRMRLVARLLRVRAELLEQLTGLPAETLTSRPVFDDSTATNILAHIASWDEFFAVRLGEVLAGRGAAIQPVEVDERNALTSRQRRNWVLDRSLAALTTARTELLATFNDISPEALHAAIGVAWGQPTVARWIEICIEHDKEHAEHLRGWRTTLGEAAQATWHTTGPGSVLAAALVAHREALLAHMAFVSPQEQETRPVVGPWTLKDLVGHVADWELQGLVFIRAILAREEPVVESDWDLDRWNAKTAAARAGEPWEKAWGDFLAARRDLLALLRSLDDDALNTAFEGPLGGTPYNWFYMAIDHDREHTEDLRRIDESRTTPEQVRLMLVEDVAVRAAIEKLYDSNPQHEWARAERHRTEFAITLRTLAQHLPPTPSRVLDCGGGPGRYAIELARQGYEVTLFDLSAGNLALAREKAAEAGVNLAAIERGTALNLSRYEDGSFDAVLIMGPLYHLLGGEERLQALAEARRVLRAGGPLFAAFITRYAAHRDAAQHFLLEPLEQPGLYEDIEQTGQLVPREGGSFVAYFARPDEVAPLVRRAGLEISEILAVEGLVSVIEDGGVNALTGPAWDWWLEANWRAAHEEALRGAVEHLLVVAHNPAWRSVLIQVVRRMNEAGIPCKVIAGASATLHGVPLKVKDIDIETDVAGVYRCAELFGAHLLAPAAHSENGVYRSHFARFNFDGIDVEIMGDLHRREGDGWTPTASLTEAAVDLDGVRIRVPWLEEELLAYLRRGRLQRAAEILPHCDQERLLALLRGQVKTQVI